MNKQEVYFVRTTVFVCLANEGDVEDMAKTMEKFLASPIPEENMKEMALRFSWKIYAEAISRPWR